MLEKDKTLLEMKIDDYKMPSLFNKIFKSMKKNGVVEITTSKVKEKLMTNFASEWLD